MSHPSPLWILALAWIGLSGCASSVKNSRLAGGPEGDPDWRAAAREQSKLDLTYMVGHNLHQLVLDSEQGKVTATAYLDHQFLKAREISIDDYLPLVERMRTESKSPAGPPVPTPTCRSPFMAATSVKSNIYNWSGCRQTEEGTVFSKIVRDAEFLLYSKK